MNRMNAIRAAIIFAATMPLAGSAAAQQGPLSFHTVSPCRVADTRAPGTNGSPMFSAGETRNFQIRGLCGVPLTAKAVSINLAVVAPSHQTWLTLWPSGTPLPGVSTINAGPGDAVTANGAIVALSTNVQDLSVLNANGTIHVIIDVNGYYQ